MIYPSRPHGETGLQKSLPDYRYAVEIEVFSVLLILLNILLIACSHWPISSLSMDKHCCFLYSYSAYYYLQHFYRGSSCGFGDSAPNLSQTNI